jgi:TP901-1 family phage major tail protein
MAYRKGSDMLLKMDVNGSGSYTTIGGIQGQRLSSKNPDVDVTNQGSPNKKRELLAGASVRSMSVSGSGTLNDAAPTPTLVSVYEAGTIRNWQIYVPGVGTWQGAFQITSLEINGPHEKDITFDIALESADSWTFTAA